MEVSKSQLLSQAVAKVRRRIRDIKERGEDIGEQDTKAILIEPILSALGWYLEELEEVRREYRRKPQDNPADYALFALRKPRLFIEAKALGTLLDQRKCARQVLGYASVVGVGWCVVTNGEEYRLYNSHDAQSSQQGDARGTERAKVSADQRMDFLAPSRCRSGGIRSHRWTAARVSSLERSGQVCVIAVSSWLFLSLLARLWQTPCLLQGVCRLTTFPCR